MASVLFIERPAWWRPIGTGLILLLVFAPSLPLLWGAADAAGLADSLTPSFRSSLINSVQVAFLAGAASLLIGLTAGALAGIYTFRFRTLTLALHVMPLLLPSHLLAIGWSSIGIRAGFSGFLAGVPGCALVFSSIDPTCLIDHAGELRLPF
jgi:ABC-type Fe3+ transport system permease subunit